MEKVTKIIYTLIIVIFLIIIGIMGWYIIDEKKVTDSEIASLKNQLNYIYSRADLEKSDKVIDSPENIRIVREYHHTTIEDEFMRVIAFDIDSKMVWSYDTESTTKTETNFDISWAGGKVLYVIQGNKIVTLSAITGDKIEEITLNSSNDEKINTFRQYEGNLYVITDFTIEGEIEPKHKLYKINKYGNIVNSKEIEALYDGFDKAIYLGF